MMKASQVPRYADLALLLTRYGLKDFKLKFSPNETILPEEATEVVIEPDVAARGEAFARKLKEMGPTYVKFGQVLSTRPDIVPKEYVLALESLQDQIEPFSYAEVERIVEEQLKGRISKLFSEFDVVPIAAASLGQVHRAVLRDGREVVVKILRPGIREQIANDLQVFTDIAAFLDRHSAIGRKMNLVGTIQQAKQTLSNELNYLQEARNTKALRRNLAEFEEIYIPEVIDDYTTSSVLTMELIEGRKISKIAPISLTDHDYTDLAAVLTRAYLKQICVDGFWHSDPHPGNIFLRDGQLVLLDFGMVSRITREFQDEVIKLLLGITENRGKEVAEVCLDIGTAQDGFDQENFRRDVTMLVANYHDVDLSSVSAGQLMFNVISVANANELQVPSELAMFAKTMLHLDSITKSLDPEYDPRTVIQDYAESLMSKKVAQKFHPKNFYSTLLDMNELIIELPKKSRKVIDQLAGGNFAMRIRLEQVDDLMRAMHKIANRITVGLVIAAMLVGSALMMRVPTSFGLWGYPAIGVLGFLTASSIGLYMVISTLLQDRRDQRRAQGKLK